MTHAFFQTELSNGSYSNVYHNVEDCVKDDIATSKVNPHKKLEQIKERVYPYTDQTHLYYAVWFPEKDSAKRELVALVNGTILVVEGLCSNDQIKTFLQGLANISFDEQVVEVVVFNYDED